MLLSLLTACGATSTPGGSTTTKKIRVGLVTDVGGLNDKGFNHLAYLGLQKAQTDLGIQGDVTESHAASDYVTNLTSYASKGYDLVIAVGFLMASAVGQVSQQYPNVKFAIIDSTPPTHKAIAWTARMSWRCSSRSRRPVRWWAF